jgi:UDPglucose 6-dehydrogenase
MLNAGIGYGGSCFPKDIKALAFMAEEMSVEPRILNAVMETNAERRERVIDRLIEVVGDLNGLEIGLLGLAFKPNTDDMREAPSVEVAQRLIAQGAAVKAYDPVALEVARPFMPEVEMAENAYQLAEGCDAIIVNTEWNEFIQLDLEEIKKKMKQPVIIDGRNIYDPEKMKALGFVYRGVGRGYNNERALIQKEIIQDHAN